MTTKYRIVPSKHGMDRHFCFQVEAQDNKGKWSYAGDEHLLATFLTEKEAEDFINKAIKSEEHYEAQIAQRDIAWEQFKKDHPEREYP